MSLNEKVLVFFLQSYFLLAASLPNQPHLLKKYQINMGFSNFHEFGILSGMCILASYQIDIAKECGFYKYYTNLILIFLPTNHDF